MTVSASSAAELFGEANASIVKNLGAELLPGKKLMNWIPPTPSRKKMMNNCSAQPATKD